MCFNLKRLFGKTTSVSDKYSEQVSQYRKPLRERLEAAREIEDNGSAKTNLSCKK